MNHGKLTLIRDHVTPIRRMRYEGRMQEWRLKVALGKNAREPAPITGRATWKIETKPHIGMQMKRLFPGIVGTPGEMYYAHSPESARNLEWFMMRYPMKIDPASEIFDVARKHREREAEVAKLMRLGKIETPRVKLARDLWDHQGTGIELAYQRRHIIIADDVGEGKTVQAVGLMSMALGFNVVVTLTHLPGQWHHVIDDWTNKGLRVHTITEGQPYDMTRRKVKGRKPATPGRMPDVAILSYSKLPGWAEYLASMVKVTIFDEVQELRTGDDSQRWDGAYLLGASSDYVMALSATPFYNYGGEFWNVAECVSPGELGTKEEFNETWCTTQNGKQVIEDPVAFGTYLYESGLMIRRCRPKQPTERIVHWVDTDHKALNAVGGDLVELARSILRKGEDSRGDKMRLSGQFDMRMRQACGIDKAPGVAEFVELLLQSEERLALYGHHREVHAIWQRMLAKYNPVMYTGSESPVEKDLAMMKFAGARPGSDPSKYTGGPARVMQIANRAGAGLDGLQYVTRVCVIGEFDWSSGVMDQNIGRVDRSGQSKTVLPYLMMSDTVSDHKLAQVNGIKRQQLQGVRDRSIGLLTELQRDSGMIREMAEEYLRSRGLSV